MSEIRKFFGIDLGTTYSCIAYLDETGRPVIVNNVEGTPTTPSVVYFESSDNIVVGQIAKDNAVLEPEKTIQFVKRQIGKTRECFNYNGRMLSPEEISSYIIRKIVKDAESELGCKIEDDVVITCPAYFGDNERNSTRQAGIIAGLNVIGIINEPTAAAISYGSILGAVEKNILVYDLGGGTFDVSILKVGKTIDTICTGGDYNLGGKNWDDKIIRYLMQEFSDQTGCTDDISENLETMQSLRQLAEKAKIQLSGKEVTTVTVQHDGMRARVEITREKFNDLSQDLLNQTLFLTDDVIEQAKKKGINTIDEFILVGGSSRMPQVSETIKTKYGIEPKLQDPDGAVAKGAALFALGGFDPDPPVPDPGNTQKILPPVRYGPGGTIPKISDVTSKSFGVEAKDRETGVLMISNIIPRNTTIPAKFSETFGTAEENQQTASIRIFENSSYEETLPVSEEFLIGEAELSLPQGLPKGAPIEVTCSLNENGILEVFALDKTGNRSVTATIERENCITQEQLEEIISHSKNIVIT